jgi:hypothetical protein
MREVHMDADKPNQTYRMHGVGYEPGITYTVSDKDADYLTSEVRRGDGKPLFRIGKAPVPRKDGNGNAYETVNVEALRKEIEANRKEEEESVKAMVEEEMRGEDDDPNSPRNLKRRQRRGKQE